MPLATSAVPHLGVGFNGGTKGLECDMTSKLKLHTVQCYNAELNLEQNAIYPPCYLRTYKLRVFSLPGTILLDPLVPVSVTWTGQYLVTS